MTAPLAKKSGPRHSRDDEESGTPQPADRLLLPVATPRRVRTELLGHLRERPLAALLAQVVVVAGVAAGLVVPWALGNVVDLVSGGAHTSSAVTAPVLVVAVACLVQALLSGWGNALVARAGEQALAGLRERALGRALAIPLERLERAGTGDLVSRVSGDVSVLADAVRGLVPQLSAAVLQIGLTLIALTLLDWRFALVVLVVVPVQVHAARWLLRTSRPVRKAERAAQGELAQSILESVDGAHTVRAFRLVPARLAVIARGSSRARDLALRSTRIGTRFFGKLNGAEWLGLSALLTVGFLLVRSGSAGVGTASAAALYFHRIFDSLNGLLSSVDEVQSAGAASARVVGVATMPLTGAGRGPAGGPAPAQSGTGGAPEGRATTVRLRGVSHAYVPGHPVLHGVDLDLAPGERVAVVGASGAGKSTLARLIAGVHKAVEGTVSLGGTPLQELPPHQLRHTVALVSQETHVFAGTLADDLRLAAPGADEGQLRGALGRVGAGAWADSLPDGLNTRTGKGGYALTPVQAQQLALARLVLADPLVAVLDEATAEAGSAGARALEAAAEQAVSGRTALIVAHRLSQARRADRVVVMEEGRIVEHGSHAELVAQGGRYAALWDAWSGVRTPSQRTPSRGEK